MSVTRGVSGRLLTAETASAGCESFVMDSVAVRQVFLQVLPYFPVPVPPTHNVIWDMDSGPIKSTEEAQFHFTPKLKRNK